MAYYTGAANSFTDLLTALLDACVANGWALEDGILIKGAAFVRPYVSSSMTNTEGPGLIIEGGTGKSGMNLTGTTNCRPRLGPPGSLAAFPVVTWPASYHIFVFTDPDEIYVVLNFDISKIYWLAFGVSDVPGLQGTGLWLAGTSRRGYGTGGGGGFSISATGGGGNLVTVADQTSAAGIFCQSNRSGDSVNSDSIHGGFDGQGWNGSAGSGNIPNGVTTAQNAFSAWEFCAPLTARSPSSWNQDTPLIPIKSYVKRPSLKVSLAVDLRNARYVRVNNYELGDIITLGSDQWMVFPFFLKNSDVPDGGLDLGHSGTFGWAIRYEGD